ncbi:hypothetical protein EV126DRAFT_463548 [Verticillium dahliae]|nr:hypothetical protein EV126DRAFT_463548 [Verticillium dahliae]
MLRDEHHALDDSVSLMNMHRWRPSRGIRPLRPRMPRLRRPPRLGRAASPRQLAPASRTRRRLRCGLGPGEMQENRPDHDPDDHDQRDHLRSIGHVVHVRYAVPDNGHLDGSRQGRQDSKLDKGFGVLDQGDRKVEPPEGRARRLARPAQRVVPRVAARRRLPEPQRRERQVEARDEEERDVDFDGRQVRGSELGDEAQERRGGEEEAQEADVAHVGDLDVFRCQGAEPLQVEGEPDAEAVEAGTADGLTELHGGTDSMGGRAGAMLLHGDTLNDLVLYHGRLAKLVVPHGGASWGRWTLPARSDMHGDVYDAGRVNVLISLTITRMWGRQGRGAVLKAMLVDSDGILDVKNDLMSLAKHEGSEEALERSCAEETQDDASLIAAHVQVRLRSHALSIWNGARVRFSDIMSSQLGVMEVWITRSMTTATFKNDACQRPHQESPTRQVTERTRASRWLASVAPCGSLPCPYPFNMGNVAYAGAQLRVSTGSRTSYRMPYSLDRVVHQAKDTSLGLRFFASYDKKSCEMPVKPSIFPPSIEMQRWEDRGLGLLPAVGPSEPRRGAVREISSQGHRAITPVPEAYCTIPRGRKNSPEHGEGLTRAYQSQMCLTLRRRLRRPQGGPSRAQARNATSTFKARQRCRAVLEASDVSLHQKTTRLEGQKARTTRGSRETPSAKRRPSDRRQGAKRLANHRGPA